MNKNFVERKNPIITSICLIISCTILNLLLSNLVLIAKLPLFLDNAGTVVAAALAGPFCGIIVGFSTNLINSAGSAVTLYYGTLSILIAICSCYFSVKGLFKKASGFILSVLSFTFIGGVIGSVITWLLYGEGIGEGVSAPFAYYLLDKGFSVFSAQFIADITIDFADKLITVAICFIILRFLPAKLCSLFSFGYIYARKDGGKAVEPEKYYRKYSISALILGLTIVTALLTSVVCVGYELWYYNTEALDEYRDISRTSTLLAAANIDGDRIDEFLSSSDVTMEYVKTRTALWRILKGSEGLKYLYVYKIEPDGCHVVFDLDTDSTTASERGEIMPFDKTFEPYIDDLLAGKPIEPVISNDSFGWLYTYYEPILDSNGNTAAYVGADISMSDFFRKAIAFFTKIISVVFCMTTLIASLAAEVGNRKLLKPIDGIIRRSRKFEKMPPEEWLQSDEWKNRNSVVAGNEIEELYNIICRMQENISISVAMLKKTERQLRNSKELEKKNSELAIAIKRADEAAAAKVDFLSRMSHDLRTPLNGIIGVAEIAKDDVSNPLLMATHISDIYTTSNFMLGLVNDILDMSKIENGAFKLNIHSSRYTNLLHNVKTMFTPLCVKKNIDFIIDDGGFDLSEAVFADKQRFEQIIFNLLSNAIKFTPENGKVEFRITSHSVKDGTSYISLMVKDSGIGISESFQKQMYDPFSQESAGNTGTTQGTGLGLSITKSLVSLMNGNIECHSEVGKGTEFDLSFSFTICENEESEASSEEAEKVETSMLSGKHVLLCEDHPLNTKIALRLLEKEGIIADNAENGKIGLNTFLSSPEGYYDAILMDIRMPVMDGLEATKNIRTSGRSDAMSIPIIAMTANAFPEDIELVRNVGMNEHLAKPVKPEVLYSTLSRLIQEN